MCVQRFDDSLNSAIHITYRISLRSSSMPEPRDPLLKVLIDLFQYSDAKTQCLMDLWGTPGTRSGSPPEATDSHRQRVGGWARRPALGNDPSAGSPTETLLRLLLPLNDRV